MFLPFFTDAQTINIHSVQANRELSFPFGYTLDGSARMLRSRLKLTNLNNFGPSGVYPKNVVITDSYQQLGSLSQVSSLSNNEIFFFGMFKRLEPGPNASTFYFQNQEINDLYSWSLNGGKMIITAGYTSSASIFNFSVLDATWGFTQVKKVTSYFLPTTDGNNTDIFNGPFGNIPEALQGGDDQGYFSVLPTNSKIFAIDVNGSPTMFMDCNTLDLIVADIDAYTDLGGISNSGLGVINNDQDRFWVNTIVFMDKLQPLPLVTQNNNEVSIAPIYVNYQWYFNNNPIANAINPTYEMNNTGAYKVEVTFNGGCKKMSNVINYVNLSANEVSFYESNIFLYPNPTKSSVTLMNNNALTGNLEISIYSATGHLIIDKKDYIEKENNINVSGLSKGVYLVKIQNENLVFNKKLIIN